MDRHLARVRAMDSTCCGCTPTEKMLDPTTLAEMLRISGRHLTDVRREDTTFPTPKMLGTLPRWSPAAIRRWMDGDVDATSCVCSDSLGPRSVVDTMPRTAPRTHKGASRV